METEGTRRGFTALNGSVLEGTGLTVFNSVADQSGTVDKLMRDEFDVEHRFDPYHVLKTIIKNILKVIYAVFICEIA